MPLPLAEAYDRVTKVDQTKTYPRYGPLPAVVGKHDQAGDWDAVGDSHRLTLSDGGHVIETIVLADAPHHLAYELTDFQKLFGKLVRNARTDWRFAAAPGGTSVDWQYEFHALPGRGWLVGLIQGLFWAPYMRKVLPGIARQVED